MSDNLMIQALLITLVAFIGYMHCYWGSTMNNRPIIVAPLVGLVLGDMTTGIMVGATLELIFLVNREMKFLRGLISKEIRKDIKEESCLLYTSRCV